MRYGVGSVALLGLVVALFSGCMATKGETVGEYVDDASITTAVKAKLAAEKASTLTRIGVDTVKGTVYLTGVVETAAIKERAGEVAGQVKGVRGVVNNLKVQGG